MFGEVVINDQSMLPLIAEFFGHGAAAIGGEILQGRRISRGGIHDNGVIHGAIFLEGLDHLGHGGILLADGHIDANHTRIFLIDDGIDG